MDQQTLERIIRKVAENIIAHTDELTALDQAIGDGDHGFNMKRGFEAVLAEVETISALPLGQALQKAGMQLVMKVGGASGPLYGTLFMTLGKNLGTEANRDGFAGAFAVAIDAVKARGKSDAGQKTMLDVLIPAQGALASGADGPAIADKAAKAAEATIPMKAIRGRASFLGDRSIGHMDPGARSSSLIIAAIVEALEEVE